MFFLVFIKFALTHCFSEANFKDLMKVRDISYSFHEVYPNSQNASDKSSLVFENRAIPPGRNRNLGPHCLICSPNFQNHYYSHLSFFQN